MGGKGLSAINVSNKPETLQDLEMDQKGMRGILTAWESGSD